MTNKVIGGFVVAVVFFLVGYGVGCGVDRSSQEAQQDNGSSKAAMEDSNEPIKIGFIAPLTGDAASIGQNARAGAAIAAREINEAGGVNGRQIEMVYEDGLCDGGPATAAANKLVGADNVTAIIGGLCSSETIAAAGVTEPAKVTTVSPCSSAPAVTDAGDYIFRVYPSDLYQGSFAAEYAYNELGSRKVAVMYSQSDWGKGIADVFISKFGEMGGQIVAKEGFDDKVRDLRTSFSKVKAAQPDLIYYVSYTEAGILGIRQARELGLDIPMLGGDAWDDPSIWSAVGSNGDGAMYTVVYTPLSDEFKGKIIEELGGGAVTLCGPQAYDGMKILAKVMSEVGTDSTDIKNALYDTVHTGGASSDRIAFDENGDLVGADYVVKVVKDGTASEL